MSSTALQTIRIVQRLGAAVGGCGRGGGFAAGYGRPAAEASEVCGRGRWWVQHRGVPNTPEWRSAVP
ncbi:hypothetical protein Cfor_02594, partial [Coptotermes formosanus]